MPCDNGDGRLGRGAAVVTVDVVVAVAEVVEMDDVGRDGETGAPGRMDVAVDVEEVDELR